jgi:hypothetical protein
VAERSFGGYAYQQRLGAGVFGEVYRALSGAGAEARIIHVSPHLAMLPTFARALVKFSEETAPFEHPRVVGLRQVGRSGEQVVVVTDAVSGPVQLRDLIGRGGPLPMDIALAIGMGAVEGLARAHALGIIHGAVHPRSVLIDFHGGVKLADFGLAWALVETAVGSEDTQLLQGLRGYVAPELALGQAASLASDVYAAGALLFDLLHGEPPPGDLEAPPRVKQIIGRALAMDPGARLADGGELEQLLAGAIAVDACAVATPGELARFVTERLAADEALHAETDDLVAALGPALGPDGVGPEGLVPGAALGSAPGPGSAGSGERPAVGRVTDLLAQLEEEGQGESEGDDGPGEMTEVDPHARGSEPDITDMIQLGQADTMVALPTGVRPARSISRPVHAAQEESTPLPTPVPHRPGSVTRHLNELEAEEQASRRRSVDELGVGDEMALLAPAASRHRPLLWVGLSVFAAAALGTVLYTQTDLFDPARKRDEERVAENEREAAIARHEAAQPVAAELTITTGEPDAAVWLLLGRTPVDSMPLSAAMVHELRVEHEGYQPLDLRVTGYQWKEEGGELRADVQAELAQGEPKGLPAYPPAPAGGVSQPPAGPRGRGVVRVQSRPVGAQVWMLIGFTPRTTITGLEAGRDYEVKVLKEGFLPGFAAVRSAEWYLSGPGGPMVTSLTREVTLAKAERKPSKPRKRARSHK